MITAIHAKKLAEARDTIEDCKFYIKELNYIAKRIQNLIKRGAKTDSLVYDTPTEHELQCLKSICSDYQTVNYDIKLVRLSNGKYRINIKL